MIYQMLKKAINRCLLYNPNDKICKMIAFGQHYNKIIPNMFGIVWGGLGFPLERTCNICLGFQNNCFTKTPNKPNMFGFIHQLLIKH